MQTEKTTRIESALIRWGSFVDRHSALLVVFICLITIFLIPFATRLELGWGVDSLLPSGKSSATERAEFENNIGGSGMLAVIVEGGKFDERKDFLDRLVFRLNQDREKRIQSGRDGWLRYAIYRLPLQFFKNRRLLYLKTKDLLDIEQRLKQRLLQEKAKRNPFYVDLMFEQEPDVDISFQDLEKKYGVQRFNEYYSSHGNKLLVALFKPTQSSANIEFGSNFIGWIENTGNEVLSECAYAGVRFSLGGTLPGTLNQKKRVVRAMVGGSILLIVFGSILALLVLRRVRILIFLICSLAVALIWLAAFAWWRYGSVSLISTSAFTYCLAFVITGAFAILRSYLQSRVRDMDRVDSLREIMLREGSWIFISAVLSFLIFIPLFFTGQSDIGTFGLIAATGSLCVGFALLVFLPALISLSEKYSLMVVTGAVRINQPIVWKIPRGKAILGIGAVLGLLGSIALAQSVYCYYQAYGKDGQVYQDRDAVVDFEIDFRKLVRDDPESESFYRKLRLALRVSYRMLYAIADDREALRTFIDELDGGSAGSEPTVRAVGSIFVLVPGEQEKKQRILDRIERFATDEKMQFLDSKTRRRIDEVRPLFHPPKITPYQFPLALLRVFSREPTGTNELFEALVLALSRLPDTISKQERRQAIDQALSSMDKGELQGLFAAASRAGLVRENEKANSATKGLQGQVNDLLCRFHDRNMGTVAYIHPELDPENGLNAIELARLVRKWESKHPGIEFSGLALDLADSITTSARIFPFGLIWMILVSIVVVLVCYKNPASALSLLTVPVLAVSALVFFMPLVGASFNVYNIAAIPIVFIFSFQFAQRIYARYWREGQIGALRTIVISSPMVIFSLLYICFCFIGWISLGDEGYLSMGMMIVLGSMFGGLFSLSFLPTALQFIHSKIRK